MPVRGEEDRRYEARYDGRDPPGYRRRNEPEPQHAEPERIIAMEQRRPHDFRRGFEDVSYKQQEMEKQTIILEKAAPDQGFGIAVSGGLDNPHNETGDTSIVVSDVVEQSPADGLLRVNDVILSVNGVNVENVEHAIAVEALKNSGYSVALVILRKRPIASSSSSPMSVPSFSEPGRQIRPANGTPSKVPTNIMLTKQPNQGYGLSLGSILFVKDLDRRGPAGRDGKLEPGDVILEINNERVDDLSRPDAVTLMRNAPERLDLVVLKNKDVPPEMPSRIFNESSAIPRSGMQEAGHNGMNGQELFQYKYGQDNWDGTIRSTTAYSVSSSGRRSDSERDIDARKDKKFHGEPHLICFNRAANKGAGLGIQVAGGNAVGIFVAALKDGSPAQVAGLRVGDQIITANDVDFKDITREEAVLLLLSLPEEVTFLVQYKKSVFDRSKEEPGDSFYVRAHFHYDTAEDDQLVFRRGEVFHVLDTMNGGTLGTWRGQRVLQNGAETECGIIPSKCRAEQLAIAQGLEDKKAPHGKQKSGTLKRKDTKTHTPKKKQYQAADHLDETSFQLDVKYPAYERVIRRNAGFVRPVVLLGPIADICRDKLMIEYPEKFTSPATFGRFDPKQQSGIKLSAVRDNIASGKHSLLDVTPEGVEMLNFVGLEPIVIFLQPSSKQLIKDLRHDLTSKSHSARFVKKLYDQAETLFRDYHYLFTGIIPLERNNKWYADCVSLIQAQQDDAIWLPEQMNSQHGDGEVVLSMPRVSVNFDADQTHLDNTVDFGDRPENPPFSGGEEEVVVAAQTMQESESAPPAVQAYVIQRGEDEVRPEDTEASEREAREREMREREAREREAREREARERETLELEQKEKELEFQRRQDDYQRQEEEREYQRKKDEEERQERDYQRRQQEDYERQIEQREYELRQYEENRRGYDNEIQPRDDRKPYIPPGIKVLPGSLPPVVSLKKTDSVGERPQDEPYQSEPREAVQLRHVERDAEGEKFDERIGVKVSDVFDIGKDIQAGAEYRQDDRRETERRQRSDSDEDETRDAQDSRVVIETRTMQNLVETESAIEPVEENMVRTTLKPAEPVAEIDFDDVLSSRQSSTNRTQTTTTLTTRTSYQVNVQPRNTVIDTRGGRRVENRAFSNYYPAKARAQIVNLDTDGGYGQEKRREEPEVKMEYESRVHSEPASYTRRPQGYDDAPAPDRRPPPPADDTARSKPYSSMYPRPFGAQSSASYTDYRQTDYTSAEGRQYNDGYQMPVPEDAAYHYGSTAYRNPATDYDDANREATSDFESVGDDEPTVVATARGIFDYRGGILTSEETGVSIYVPSGAIPFGVEQEIYFKVCTDNSMLPPLDTDKGETLLSPLVMCGPHGTKFLKPVELRLPHSASMTPEGWSFALKSSDTATGQPTTWKNTSLADRSDQQCKVSSNSVSVLVDHF